MMDTQVRLGKVRLVCDGPFDELVFALAAIQTVVSF